MSMLDDLRRFALNACLLSLVIGCSSVAGTESSSESEVTERVSASSQALHGDDDGLWLLGGKDAHGTRDQSDEHELNPHNVSALQARFTFTTGGNVSATPAVDDDAVYFPDFVGNLFKINRRSGALIWSHRISEYTGVAASWSRSSPALSGNRLIIGDQEAGSAHVIALDKRTGNLLWISTLDTHPLSIVTQSPLVVDGRVFVSTSSREEGASINQSYACCTFRASVNALDERTGALIWKTYMVPDNGGLPSGYSGAAIWGGPPAYDRERRTVYVSTGNNYSVPADVAACLLAVGSADAEACLAKDDFVDSIVALDARTGRVKWGRRLGGADTFTRACLPVHYDWCPKPEGPDYDFASGVNLFSVGKHRRRDLVGCGQKSGVYWALDPDTGRVVWNTQVGPAGPIGGIMWGSATDGEHVFVANSNSYRVSHVLEPSGEVTSGGTWTSLNATTGEIEWQTADPTGSYDMAALSTANGLVFACSLATTGANQFALSAKSGKILWSYESGASCNAGPAISRGTVYWGTGYTRLGLGTGSTSFRAFSLPRHPGGNHSD